MSSSSNSTDATSPGALAAIDAMLQSLDQSGGPGLAVGITRRGESVYRRASGLASVEHGVANTLATRWRIGSTTKHFASLAVLLLAEDGSLSIDDPVYRHLPELAPLAAGPTLRQLMNHTGGWRCHLTLSSMAHGLAIQPKGSAMPLLVRQRELNFEPGSQMIYSNGGYVLLSEVIERVSGRSFADFLAERIFEPMEMRGTSLVRSDFDVCPGMASTYLALPGQPLRKGINFSEDMLGDGGIVSTIDDMLVWLAHLRGHAKRVGSAHSWARMIEPTVLRSGVEVGYGLGLMRHRYRGVEVIHHAGGTIGSASQMITVPEHELDIVVLANGAPVSPVALAFGIIDALLADVLPQPPDKRASAGDFANLVGVRYHSAATGLLLQFADVRGQLGLSWLGSVPTPLHEDAVTGALRLETQDIALSPIEIDAAQFAGGAAPQTLRVSEGGQLRFFVKVPAEPHDIAALALHLVGDFVCHDLDARARFEVSDSGVTLSIQGMHGCQTVDVTALLPDVLDVVSTDPLLRMMGERGVINLERPVSGQVQGFRIDIGRIRHLGFVREGSARASAPAGVDDRGTASR
jgi:D-aminopeptidase